MPKIFTPKATYFIVFFKDENLTLPIIRTLTYEHSIVRENGAVRHIFQAILFENEDAITQFVDDEYADELVLDPEGLLIYLNDCFNKKL